MATLLNNAGLYVGEYDLSAVLNEIALEADADVLDVTTFGASFRDYAIGLKGARFSAAGGMAYLMRGCVPSYRVGGSIGQAGVVNLTGQTTQAPIVQGRTLHRATAAGATATGTALQLGAVAADKSIYGTLHVFGIDGTGTPTLAVKIQSDNASGFSTPIDRLTFTNATAIGAQWVSSGPGAITDDWWRVSFTISGTGPSFGFVVGFGIF